MEIKAPLQLGQFYEDKIMSDGREEMFVVPKKPSAGTGWWLGHVLNSSGRFLQVNILWVQTPECHNSDSIISTVTDCIHQFDTVNEAMDCLRQVGAIPKA